VISLEVTSLVNLIFGQNNVNFSHVIGGLNFAYGFVFLILIIKTLELNCDDVTITSDEIINQLPCFPVPFWLNHILVYLFYLYHSFCPSS